MSEAVANQVRPTSINDVHGDCLNLLDVMRQLPSSRELSLAITNMEQVCHRLRDRVELEERMKQHG